MIRIQPSYAAGFARSAAESEYPELWRGLVGAWVPALGATGLTLQEVCFGHSATLSNITWGAGGLEFGAANNYGVTTWTIKDIARGWMVLDMHVHSAGTYGRVAGNLQAPNNGFYTNKWVLGATEFASGIAYGTRARVAMSWDGTTVETWKNGARLASTASAAYWANTGAVVFQFGNLAALNRAGDFVLYVCLLGSGVQDLRAFTSDPLAPFRLKRRVYAPALAPAGGFKPAWAVRRQQTIGAGVI